MIGGDGESTDFKDTEVGTAQAQVYFLREATSDYRYLLQSRQADTAPTALLEVRLDVRLSSPTPLLSQGRTPTAAAAESTAQKQPEPRGSYQVLSADASTGEGALVQGDVQGLQAIICSATYSWDCETALRIVQCESNWDAAAVSRGNYGLFQINVIHAYRWANWSEWMNPEVNTAWAYELWAEQGWGIWGCH
jgi:hypothetical protein